MNIRKIIREELGKIFIENKLLNEIGPDVAARALRGNIGKIGDLRAEQILKDAITSMFSKYIGKDMPFYFIARKDGAPVKYDLIEVTLSSRAKFVFFYFYNEDGVDSDSPYALNKKEIRIGYDIENDKFGDEDHGNFQYFVNPFTANFFAKSANLLRRMYYKAYPWYSQIEVKDEEMPWKYKSIPDPDFDIKSKVKKGDFRMFSYDSENLMNMNENYPMGAQYDSRAPWNQVDNTREGEKAKKIVYNLLWTDNTEFAFFECPQGTCVLYIDSIDRNELEPYADREETYLGKDEDGMPDIEYGDWEITGEVIENYVNDNLESMKMGKGLDDYESGNYDLVLLDDELRADLMGIAKYIKNDRDRNEFIKVVSGQVNEAGVTDLVNKETMDTPTGTLFVMNVNENSNAKRKKNS